MKSVDSEKRIQRIIIKFAIVFFIVMLVLLFFSKTVETMLLPAVTTFTPIRTTISDSYEFSASVTYENTKKSYTSFDYFIEQVLIEQNQFVKIGMPIAKLRDRDVNTKRSEFEQRIFDLESIVINLEESLKKWMPRADKERTDRMLERAKENLIDKQEEMDFYFSKIDENNQLLSEVEGKVICVSMQDQSFAYITSSLFEYIDKTSETIIAWNMPVEKAEKFNIESSVIIKYDGFEQGENGIQTYKLCAKESYINSIEYDGLNECYNYKVVLSSEKDLDIISSPKLKLILRTPSIDVENAVPRSAVFEDTESAGLVIYSIKEDQKTKDLIVRKHKVNIVNEYEIYCEVSYDFFYGEQIVLTTTKPLYHNMKVKLR